MLNLMLNNMLYVIMYSTAFLCTMYCKKVHNIVSYIANKKYD